MQPYRAEPMETCPLVYFISLLPELHSIILALNSKDIKSFVVSTLTLAIVALPLLRIKLLFWIILDYFLFDLAALCACGLAFLSAHTEPG